MDLALAKACRWLICNQIVWVGTDMMSVHDHFLSIASFTSCPVRSFAARLASSSDGECTLNICDHECVHNIRDRKCTQTIRAMSAHMISVTMSAHRPSVTMSAHRPSVIMSAHMTSVTVSAHRPFVTMSAHITSTQVTAAAHAISAVQLLNPCATLQVTTCTDVISAAALST